MSGIFSFLQHQLDTGYLGVDIGTTAIKVVEVRRGAQLPLIVNYGIAESKSHLLRPSSVLQTSSLKMFEGQVVDFLTALLDRMQPKAREAVVSLSTFNAFTTVLDFPEMSSAELQQAIQYQARQYIPLPLSEVALDWVKVGEYRDQKGFKHEQILLISVPQEQIKRYQAIFATAGIRLRALEIETLSLVRGVIGTDKTPTLIIDIGSRSTNIVFADEGQLLFSAQSDFASTSLTQALATSLGISPVRAEDLKRERGVIATGPTRDMAAVMLPMLDVIMGEVRKALFTYESRFGHPPTFERILLAGGGANLLGLESYVQSIFSVPVAKVAPFYRFEYDAHLEPLIPELNPILGTALGLTLREFV